MPRKLLHQSSIRRALLACAGLALPACSDHRDVVAPPVDQPFDAQAAANSIYSLRFAADNAVLVQVRTISEVLGLAQTERSADAAAAVAGPLRLPVNRRGGRTSSRDRAESPDRAGRAGAAPRALVDAVLQAARARAGGARVPLFPINYLGKAFAFDPDTDAYFEVDASGPDNGVRFELYDVDLHSGLPALPLRPRGFVDLTDHSDAVSTRLRVRASDASGGGRAQAADYMVDGAHSVESARVAVSLLAEGFVEDGHGRFDFELDELVEYDDGAEVARVTAEHRVVSAENTDVRLRVEGDASYDGARADFSFLMDIAGLAGRDRIDLRVRDGAQAGEILHEGRPEVTVGGTVSAPTFLHARGGAPSDAELAALDELLFGIDDVLLLAGEAYAPLADLFAY